MVQRVSFIESVGKVELKGFVKVMLSGILFSETIYLLEGNSVDGRNFVSIDTDHFSVYLMKVYDIFMECTSPIKICAVKPSYLRWPRSRNGRKGAKVDPIDDKNSQADPYRNHEDERMIIPSAIN